MLSGHSMAAPMGLVRQPGAARFNPLAWAGESAADLTVHQKCLEDLAEQWLPSIADVPLKGV